MFPQSFFLQLVQKDFSEFEDFLQKSGDEDILQLLHELHPADIADIVERLSEDNQTRVMSLLDNSLAAEVLSLVEQHHQSDILEAIPDDKLPHIIDAMASDDATDILEDLPAAEAKEILDALPHEEAAPMRQLLSYDEDSAGGLMQTELVAVRPEMTLFEAAERLREMSRKIDDVRTIYVVNDEGILRGVIPILTLVFEAPERLVSQVMETDFISVPVGLDQEHVAEKFRKYDLISAPVVDQQNQLLGRITVDDVVDVIREEASEDIYRLAGMGTEEHVTDSSMRSVRLRLPWLLFNLLTAMVAASVVGLFQSTIERLVVLAVFMPIVAGMGGNAGTQSLTVVTRGIALGELTFANARKVLIKELTAGICNGLFIGVVMGVLAYFWQGSPVLGLVLGIAMIGNMFVAALFGTAIPLFLKWIKVDPALASGVIVTTFTDTAGFFGFLGLATLFLRYLV